MAQVAELAKQLKAREVKTVAICFLNSYRNPENERIVGDELRRLLPGVYFSLSSEVAPQIREYQLANQLSQPRIIDLDASGE